MWLVVVVIVSSVLIPRKPLSVWLRGCWCYALRRACLFSNWKKWIWVMILFFASDSLILRFLTMQSLRRRYACNAFIILIWLVVVVIVSSVLIPEKPPSGWLGGCWCYALGSSRHPSLRSLFTCARWLLKLETEVGLIPTCKLVLPVLRLCTIDTQDREWILPCLYSDRAYALVISPWLDSVQTL